MDQRIRVLIICAHNSGRSQMAEALLKKIAGNRFTVESAGLDPKPILPEVVTVMQEIGIDLKAATSQSVFELFKASRLYRYVIAVCDTTTEKQCPVFPGVFERLHWPFPDPEKVEGETAAERLDAIRAIRDAIRDKLTQWVATVA